MKENNARKILFDKDIKSLVIDTAVENCDTSLRFSEMNFVNETRRRLEDSSVCEYIPEFADGTLSKESFVDAILETAMNKGFWPDNGEECEYEVVYTENYPLFGTPALTINYWSTDDSFGRWTMTCISLPDGE